MSIKRTILGAFGYVYEYRETFAKALLIPIIILIALETIPFPEVGLTPTILLAITSLFIYTILAITTHRIILLGPKSVPEWGMYFPQKRELNFILYSIALVLCMIPFGFLFLVPNIGWAIAIIGIVYISARLSLVFPAIATDQSWSFSDSWKATQSHQVLMMIVVAIFPFVISVPEYLLSELPYVEVLVSLLSAFTMVFVVAALSVAFQVITENSDES